MRSKTLDAYEFATAAALLVVLNLLVSAAFGAPTRSDRAELLRSGLGGLLGQARHYAIASGLPVVLCPIDGYYRCTDGQDWSRGWIGFMDHNRNRQYDYGDELLRRDQPLEDGQRLHSLSARGQILFEPRSGRLTEGAGFVLCESNRPEQAVELTLSGRGQPHLDTRAAAPTAAARCAPREHGWSD